MPLQEVAELVTQWVCIQVNEDDVAGWMNADRQALREVPNEPLIALVDGPMRTIVARDSAPRAP